MQNRLQVKSRMLPSGPMVKFRLTGCGIWCAGWWHGRQRVHAEASQEEENWRRFF